MANFKFVKSATALVLGASVLTSAVVVPGANASAKTTYKVNKNGTLVNAKTNKTVKGYVSYKGKLYKDGKKFTGLYNKKYYYKSGVKATGTYKGAYYVKGAKKVTTGTYNGKYYVKGALYTGKTSKNIYYVKGVKFTGVTKYGYTYKDGKRVEGEYQGKVYTNGKLVTGLYKDKLYKAGELVKGFALEKEKLYKDGVLNIGLALFQDKLYNDADLNKGLKKYEDKFYFDADLADGTYDDNGVERAIEKGVEVGAKVKSVEAINGTQLKVTFNKSVDTDTVTASTVVVTGQAAGTTYTVTPSEDKKSATIKFNKAVSNKTDLVVTVNGVKVSTTEDVKYFSDKLTLNDTVAPTVVSAVAKTNADKTNVVTIKFSEPVKFGSVKVDGKFVSAVAVSPNASGYTDTYTLTGAVDSLEAGKTYDVELNGIKDESGNNADAIVKTSVTVEKDAVKPVASLSSATGENTFNVNFDKEMSSTISATNIKVYKTNADGSQTQLALTKLPTLSKDGKSFAVSVDTTSLFATTDSSKDLTVKVSGLKDALGNVMNDYEGKVSVVKDTVAPTIVSVKQDQTDAKKLNATFSEDVKGLSTFNVIDSEGNKVAVAKAASATTTDGKVALTIYDVTDTLFATPKELSKSGSYKLVAQEKTFTDTSATANKNDAQVVSFNYVATAAAVSPITASLVANDGAAVPVATSTTSKKVAVTFTTTAAVVSGYDDATGKLKDGAVQNLTNFTVDGASLPDGAKVTYDASSKTAVIDFTDVVASKLPAAFVNGGKIAVSASGVKNVDGATLAYTTNELTVADLAAPTVSAAYLAKNSSDVYTLTVEFSEAVKSATVTKDSVLLTGVTTTVDPTVTVAADGKSATFVYDAADVTAISAATTLSVTTDLEDANSNAASAKTDIAILKSGN